MRSGLSPVVLRCSCIFNCPRGASRDDQGCTGWRCNGARSQLRQVSVTFREQAGQQGTGRPTPAARPRRTPPSCFRPVVPSTCRRPCSGLIAERARLIVSPSPPESMLSWRARFRIGRPLHCRSPPDRHIWPGGRRACPDRLRLKASAHVQACSQHPASDSAEAAGSFWGSGPPLKLSPNMIGIRTANAAR